jgi:putative membrane protein
MRIDLITGRRVVKHGLVIATTVLTCTALQAAPGDTAQQPDQNTQQTDQNNTAGQPGQSSSTTAATPSDAYSTRGARGTPGAQGDKAEQFVRKALMGGQMEVQMGRLAQQKGQSQEVKDLGATLVRDHAKADQQLRQIASTKNIQNVSGGAEWQGQKEEAGQAQGNAYQHERGQASTYAHGEHGKQMKHQKMLSKLQNESGAEFDKDFVRMAIRDHKKDIAEFEKCRTDVSDPQITAFIDQTLPTLRNHLQMAETAARAVGVDASQITAENENENETSATGAAAPGVSGSSDQNKLNSNENSTPNTDSNSTPDNTEKSKDQNHAANIQGNVGSHEFSATGDINNGNASVTTDSGKHKIFQKGDGKVLGLSTDKSDGKFLGIIPDPKKKTSTETDVNINTSDSSVGGSASTQSGSSSSSSSDQR